MLELEVFQSQQPYQKWQLCSNFLVATKSTFTLSNLFKVNDVNDVVLVSLL